MATNTDTDGDAQQAQSESATVDRSALGDVYEAACREYDAREDLHAHPEGEKETLLNALKAVKFALDEGIVKAKVAVDRSHLSTVHEAAKAELDSMTQSMCEQESIETLRDAIETIGRVLSPDQYQYDSDDTTTTEGE